MNNLIELNGNWNETTGELQQKFAMLIDSDVLLAEDKTREIVGPSAISLIVYRLIAESKHGEMLNRLQVKLGRTKEEVYMLISEL
jgi:hypothetical protein